MDKLAGKNAWNKIASSQFLPQPICSSSWIHTHFYLLDIIKTLGHIQRMTPFQHQFRSATFVGLCLFSFTACQPPKTESPQPNGKKVASLHSEPAKSATYTPQEGDIFFQSSPKNPLTEAIEGTTNSPFSHCAILHKVNDQWMFVEAIATVRDTPAATWIHRGRENRYTVFRLKKQYRDKIPSFISAAETYKGLPYDIHFEMDDKAMYCSELVYKAFRDATGEKLGKTQTLGELNWQPHTLFIKSIENGKVPLEREMITPRAVSEASQIEQIYSGNIPFSS